ncbi:MAG: RNA-binding S4 domain-containing protein [Lachnospiraceae bacterium]|nr:RNA-binding S4 domain-containing protein [Lachnospiraceae bacterium]
MEVVTIKDEFIKLGQALKLAGAVDSGLDAKIEIQNGKVKVNGETDLRRGRKLVDGDVVTYGSIQFQIKNRS